MTIRAFRFIGGIPWSQNSKSTMAFLTNDKLVIVGAAGMIGSNMAQTALMMGLTSEICLYDVFSPEGVAEEMRQSGFDDVNIVATTNEIGRAHV